MSKFSIKNVFGLLMLALASLYSGAASADVYMGSWDLTGTGQLQQVWNNGTQIKVLAPNGTSTDYSVKTGGFGASWQLMGAEDLNGDAGKELILSVATSNTSVLIQVISHKTKSSREYSVGYSTSWQKIAIEDLDGKPGKELVLNIVGQNGYHEYRVLHFPTYHETSYRFSNESVVILTNGIIDTDGKPGAEIVVNRGGDDIVIIHDSTQNSKTYPIGAGLWSLLGFSDLNGIAGNEVVLRYGDYLKVINDVTGELKNIFVGGNFAFNSFQNVDGKGGNDILISKNNAIQTFYYYIPPVVIVPNPGAEFSLQHSGGLCVHPKGGANVPANGTPAILFPMCDSSQPRLKFKLAENKSLQHVSSGMCLHPEGGSDTPAVGTRLVFWNQCSISRLQNIQGNPKLAFEFTAGGSIRHIKSGLCVHPSGGSPNPVRDTSLVLWAGCDEPRLTFNKL
ncbi:MAG: hypothetical protein V4805_04800 [Pseudomonadota bacterium]